MAEYGLKISCVIILTLLFLHESSAQERGVGTSYSYAGVGLTYEQPLGNETFMDLQLRAEAFEIFHSNAPFPGMSASMTWNMYFADFQSGNGNDIRFFAGSGVIIGYMPDMRAPYGGVFGLKGRVGGECRFDRNVAISMSLSPILGAHVTMREGMPHMKLFMNGLIYGLMPEVGIKYLF